MRQISFDRLPRLFDGKITNIQYKYEQPDWLGDNIIFTVLFEVNERLFYISADKTNLVELLTKTNVVGFFQDIQVDVSGCFLKNLQPLLWKDFFRLYFNNESAETVVKGCISLNKYYKTVNLKNWSYFESPFNDWDRDDIFDNVQTLSIKYFLDDKQFEYDITKFDLMSVLSRSKLVNFTLYNSLRASTEGVRNNKGEWVEWQTFFNNDFTEISAMAILKEHLLCGRYQK